MPSNVERAWVAGIVDGEGCVTLIGSINQSAFRKPLISVDNTDVEILNELGRLYGGRVVAKKKAADHHRQAWTWRVYGADNIIALLREIVPYMRCAAKLERAWLLLDEYKRLTPRNGWYTDEARRAKLDFERRFMAVGAGRGSQCRPILAPRLAEESGVEPLQV
ncbi:hypothetical protein [Micromonospora sp. NPDC005173]|uniref:hypothetical protein n=1 Tax=Micromonospora sp. NPDC005173 TaxID=3157165 RepID=UPI0033B7BF3C